jgi:hypothetical protein
MVGKRREIKFIKMLKYYETKQTHSPYTHHKVKMTMIGKQNYYLVDSTDIK